MDIKKMKDFLDTEEGKKSLEDFFGGIQRKEDMLNSQLDRFHAKCGDKESFLEFFKKVEAKYDSIEYQERYWEDSEPEYALHWFLFEYAKKYGNSCDDAEWSKYGNMFTGELFQVHGYYFQVMNGQGSVIRIDKADDEFLNYNI